MDSVTQLALGSAIGVAVMGRRTAVWKAALWGGVCGTLPDLDAFIDHGDAIRNMTFHRAESHALFFLTLAAPPIAWLVSRLHGEQALIKRWCVAVWLALVTHPLLDLMTVYGTQLLRPFTDYPYAVGSIFIIDPLYTLPLLAGVGVALATRSERGLRWNAGGLVLSTAYLAWSAVAQQWATQAVQASIRQQGLQVQQLLVTPTPFNTLLWRVVAITPQGYSEGFHSLFDGGRPLRLDAFARNLPLYETRRGDWYTERIAWFSHGFFRMSGTDVAPTITDLRMGQEPAYSFSFELPAQTSPDGRAGMPVQLPMARPDARRVLPWMWQRLWGADLPPPR
jgi:inner membrane protein